MSFHGPVDSIGLTEEEIVDKGWDLADLPADYEEALEEFRAPEPHGDDEVVFTEIRPMGRMQGFTFTDPQLPKALLPGWIGRSVAGHIMSLRDQWAETVKARWAEINAC